MFFYTLLMNKGLDFAKILIDWYLTNKRNLPWRKTKDPYIIFLSEIILQQTRVSQGLPYFERFASHFPTVDELAKAQEQEVLKLWQGLGYYSRARNMHAAVQMVMNDYGGLFPKTYKELLLLKGVGEYTAAAIASFSNDEPVPVVDGNVFRVLARVYGIDADISNSSSKKIFQERAKELMPVDCPSDFNQAIMEFGALQCVPKSPSCESCVLAKACVAYSLGKVAEFPVKTKKIKVKKRYLNYLIVEDATGRVMIEKREGKGIWQNLFQFPLVESQKTITTAVLNEEINNAFDFKVIHLTKCGEKVIHKLSHQELHVQFWSSQTKSKLAESVAVNELVKYPFPIVIAKFIERYWSLSF